MAIIDERKVALEQVPFHHLADGVPASAGGLPQRPLITVPIRAHQTDQP
ncbi:hypothetical protein ACTJJB_23240 [Chitinophaga sp. 22536]